MILEQLATPFPPHQVKTRHQAGRAILYVSIDDIIERLNTVCGSHWSSEVKQLNLVPHGDKNGKPQYMATVIMKLNVTTEDGTIVSHEGVGGAIGADVSVVSKTAQADALAKCAHYFGISAELWKPARRAFCTYLHDYTERSPEQVVAKLNRAIKEWQADSNNEFTTYENKRDLTLQFLRQAQVSDEEIGRIKERCVTT